MRFSFEKKSTLLRVPVETTSGVFQQRESLIIHVINERGDWFSGECAPWIGFGVETLSEAEAFLRSLDGNIPAKIPKPLPCLAHAFSAAMVFSENPHLQNPPTPEKKDCAKLLPRTRQHSKNEILDSLFQEYDEGYSTFKIKIGLSSENEELRFCEELLQNVPTGTKIRFDANGALSEKSLPALTALSTIPQLDFFEQPLQATRENDHLIFSLADKKEVKFALDESVREPWAFPQKTRVVAVIKPLLIASFPRLLNWLGEKSGADVVISSVFENSSFGRDALLLACARISENRQRAFGLG